MGNLGIELAATDRFRDSLRRFSEPNRVRARIEHIRKLRIPDPKNWLRDVERIHTHVPLPRLGKEPQRHNFRAIGLCGGPVINKYPRSQAEGPWLGQPIPEVNRVSPVYLVCAA